MRNLQEGLSKLLQGAGVLVLSKITARVLGLVGHIALVRVLLPKLFGRLTLAFVVVSTVALLLELGLPQGVARNMAADREGVVPTARAGYQLTVPVAVLGSLTMFVGRNLIASAVGTPTASDLIAVLSLYLLFAPMSAITMGTLRGLELSKETAVARDIGPRVAALAVFAAFVVSGQEVLGALLYWIVAPALTLTIGVIVLKRHFRLRELFSPRIDLVVLRRLIGFSWPLALQAGFVVLMIKVDILAIGYFLNPRQVGYYKSIQPLAKSILLILTSFVFLYLPIATEFYESNDIDSLSKIYVVSTKWIVLATLPFALVLIVFPSGVISTVLSPRYLPATSALSVLTVGMFLRVFVGPNGANIQAVDRTRVDLVSSALGLLTNLILNVILVPRYGIVGAAVATGAGFLAFNLLELGVLLQHTGIHPFSWNTAKPVVLTTTLVYAGSLGLPVSTTNLLNISVVGLCVAVVHLVSVFVTRSFQPEDIVLFENIEEYTGVNLSLLKRFASG